MSGFIIIMTCIASLFAFVLPIILIIMTPFVIVEMINWFRELYFYIKEYWKEKFR